jgi:hypothetical protein
MGDHVGRFTKMRLHHGVRTLTAVLMATAFSAPAAYGRFVDRSDPAYTAAGPAVTASSTTRPNPDQNGANATASDRSDSTTEWVLIGLGAAGGIALIGTGAAAARRPSRRTARVRAGSGS